MQPFPKKLLTLLGEWSAERPHDVVVTDYEVHASRMSGALQQRSRTTTRQLWEMVVNAAAGMREMGVRRGDVIAIQLPTWHEYVVANLAAYAAGAVTMPISPIYRGREVSRQLELSSARILFVAGEYGNFDYVRMAAELQIELPTLQNVIVVGGEGGAHTTWAQLMILGASSSIRREVASGTYAPQVGEFSLLNFTSGTTGVPKGVMHSVATISAAVDAVGERMEITSSDAILIAVTLGHAAGFLNGIYLPLLRRVRTVYMDLWDPGMALDLIEKERITYGPMMPTFLFDLVRHERFGRVDVSSLVKARVSGGAISRSLMALLNERLPKLKLLPGWGMSEASYLTCGSPADPPAKLAATDGRPLSHAHIEIRDAGFRRTLGPCENGEIVVRASSIMLGYHRQEELTRAAFTDDGFLKTGDIGHIDSEGFLVMVGRSKELVIRGGENVPVVEVENTLMEHPKVASASVIGVPDERLGEKVCVAIVPRCENEPLSQSEMRAFLEERQLTRQFIPEYIVNLPGLPKTALGKVRKHELRAQVLAMLAVEQKQRDLAVAK